MTRIEWQMWAVGAVTFPVSQFDDQGRTSYYASAATTQGDEYFTEIQPMVEDRAVTPH